MLRSGFTKSGVYTLTNGSMPYIVFCDMEQNGIETQILDVSRKVSKEELEVTKGILLAEINKKPSQTDLNVLKVGLSKTISSPHFYIFLSRATYRCF